MEASFIHNGYSNYFRDDLDAIYAKNFVENTSHFSSAFRMKKRWFNNDVDISLLFLADQVVNQIIKCLIPRDGVTADCVLYLISKMCANAISINIQVITIPYSKSEPDAQHSFL